MNECPRCGQAGMRDITHACMTAGTPIPQPFDPHHWLYKAGYDDGYRAALRERDLSPAGMSRPQGLTG